MFVLATPIVDWGALWKICVVTLIAGAGVVVAYGFLLLGLKLANNPGADGTQSGTSRVTGFALSFACGVLVIGVITLGIIAMIDKPPNTKSKAKKSAAALTAPARRGRLGA